MEREELHGDLDEKAQALELITQNLRQLEDEVQGLKA